MNKQIEEMAKIICKPTANKGNCETCGFKRSCSKFDDATDLYNAGFRKTNKWIPVTERFPNLSDEVLTYSKNSSMVFEWRGKSFYLCHPLDAPSRTARSGERRCGVMAELLKRSFELFVKKRWLKTINKECDKYNKIKSKLFRQQHVVISLLAEYKKVYGEDLRKPPERSDAE